MFTFTIDHLYNACIWGDIQSVREIVSSKEMNINVANHLANEEAIDILVDDQDIPKSLKPLVADFIGN